MRRLGRTAALGGHDPLDFAQDGAHVLDQAEGKGARFHPVADADEERVAKLLAQAVQGVADRGRRLVQLTRPFTNQPNVGCLSRAGKGGVALRKAVSANAAAFVADLAPGLADIRAAGRVSRRAVAAELTARGIKTRRGGGWNVGNVGQLLLRTSNLSFQSEAEIPCQLEADGDLPRMTFSSPG